MQVDVEDRLPCVLTAVHYHPVAALGKAHFFRQLGGHPVQVAHQLAVVFCNVIDGCDGLLRDDQQVNRRLRVDVAERQAEIVFVDDVCRDLAVDDLGENSLRHDV